MSVRGLVLAAAVLGGTWAQAAPLAPGSATAGKAKRSAGKGVLNLNTATLDQIDALPGISPQVAAAVVAERSARPFSRPEDVMRVRGLEPDAVRAPPPPPHRHRRDQLRARCRQAGAFRGEGPGPPRRGRNASLNRRRGARAPPGAWVPPGPLGGL